MNNFLIVSSFVIFIVIAIFVWYYFLGGTDDLKKAKKEFEIFGLKDGFVPQGITYLKKECKFLICGYMSKKHEPSRIYVIDAKTKIMEKFVTLQFVGGKSYIGHAGGIANHSGSCWIASEGFAFRFLVSDLMDAKCGKAIRIVDKFKTYNNADFCFTHDGYLWVGEFYKLGKFNTDVTHHLKQDDGNYSHAVAFAFPLSICSTCGVDSTEPEKALSLPDICQGVSISDDEIFASCSYGISKSNIFVYDNILRRKSQKYFIINEKKIDLYELSSKYLKNKYILPEMSEEIEIVDDKLYIVFESASKKYRIVTRTSINYVYSIK